MSTLLEPFSYEFFRNAMLVAIVAGALCGLVGTYVVLRGMSYIGHGLSHAIFGGAVIGAALAVNFYLAAGVLGLISVMLIQKVSRRRTIGADAAIGVVTIFFFAVGLAIISQGGTFQQNFDAALFGNVLGVTMGDVLVVVGVFIFVVAVIFVRYRQLLFTTFDPEVAQVSGVKTAWMDFLLGLILAATIASTMNVVGVTLIAGMLVIPPVIARLLTDSFSRMLWISTGVGAVCGLVGTYLSYFLDWASGPAIIIVASAVFVVAFAYTGLRRRRLPMTALAEHVD